MDGTAVESAFAMHDKKVSASCRARIQFMCRIRHFLEYVRGKKWDDEKNNQRYGGNWVLLLITEGIFIAENVNPGRVYLNICCRMKT